MNNEVQADPLSLSGLRQAHYIARCLQSGLDENDIIARFSGDSQLVKMWLAFLIHNKWMQPVMDDQNTERWIVTDKGRTWLEIIEAKFSK